MTAEETSPERLPEEDEEEEAEAGDGSRAEDAAEGTETGAEETEPDANAGVSKQKSDSMLPSTPAGHKLGTKGELVIRRLSSFGLLFRLYILFLE